MKPLALAFGLCLLLSLSITLSRAQDGNAAADEASAVQATVRNYIEGYYRGDAPRMAQTLHAHYLKHMIHGTIPMREKTGQQMLEEVRSHGPANLPEADKTEQIRVLDIEDNIASAKLITPGWVDYITLEKAAGNWKILSVVQRIDN
jgi:Putative lumazine-binding